MQDTIAEFRAQDVQEAAVAAAAREEAANAANMHAAHVEVTPHLSSLQQNMQPSA